MPGKISTVVLPRRQMQLSEAEPLGQSLGVDGMGGAGASDRTESQNLCFLWDRETPVSLGTQSIGWVDIPVTFFF